jgi:hypothetical protein
VSLSENSFSKELISMSASKIAPVSGSKVMEVRAMTKLSSRYGQLPSR